MFDCGDEWRLDLEVADSWAAEEEPYPMLVEAVRVPPPKRGLGPSRERGCGEHGIDRSELLVALQQPESLNEVVVRRLQERAEADGRRSSERGGVPAIATPRADMTE